jgi:DNA-binding NarL/FixJ family response regulator
VHEDSQSTSVRVTATTADAAVVSTLASGRPVHLLLVAPHDLVTESLCRALDGEDAIEVVATAAPTGDIVAAIERCTPEVVLVTVGAHDTSGIDALVRLRDERAAVPVVLLSDQVTGPEFTAALAAGCAGFVAWDGGFAELLSTIRVVADGGTRVPGALAAEFAMQLQPHRHSSLDLSPRELEVLSLLAEGLSTEEIVERLTVSIHTVRNHIRGALAKLDAHSRLEAVAIATRRGFIAPFGKEAVATRR